MWKCAFCDTENQDDEAVCVCCGKEKPEAENRDESEYYNDPLQTDGQTGFETMDQDGTELCVSSADEETPEENDIQSGNDIKKPQADSQAKKTGSRENLLYWTVLALLAVILVVSYFVVRHNAPADEQVPDTTTIVEPVSEPGTDAAAAPAEPSYVIDYDALFKSHDPEEVVMTVDGREISWNEYFYWIRYYAEYIQYYIDMYKYYGMDYKWTDPADEEGTMTLADSVRQDAGNHMSMICSIENFAEQNGIELPEETVKLIEDDLQAAIKEYCGEGATEEDFDRLLRESDYLTLEIYKRYNRANYLYQEIFNQLYGKNGEKVSDEDAIKHLEENGYMRANHILFMTIDPATGEALDEAAVAEKKALAEKTAEELKKIKKTDKLLKRFAELKTEYDEDSGKVAYPDGYVFTSGKMVKEFEDGYNGLKDFEVSDPILSTYGYHVMIRLPNDPDAVIEYSDEGTALNARMVYANAAYAELMQGNMDSAEIVVSDSIIGLNLADYLTEVSVPVPETTEETPDMAGE